MTHPCSRRLTCWLILAVGLSAAAQDKPGLEGTWQGTLDLGVANLRLVVEFSKKEGGGLTGKMDSPDQQLFGLPIDEVTLAERTVTLTLKKIGGSYEGELSEDGKTIEGTTVPAMRASSASSSASQ